MRLDKMHLFDAEAASRFDSHFQLRRRTCSAEPKSKKEEQDHETTLESQHDRRARVRTGGRRRGFGTDDARVLGGANQRPDLMRKLFDNYEKQNPGVKIEIETAARRPSCSGNTCRRY